jgi:hypothetical protein
MEHPAMMRATGLFLLVAGLCACVVSPAHAHHEAIFGPQSSAVLSPGTFLTAQVFTRATGRDDEKGREITTVFSGGVRPFNVPLSLAFVVPVTFAHAHGDSSERGFEDALISARYRLNAAPIAEALGLDSASVMGVGGIEIPTGTLDHSFGRGPLGQIAAGLISLERTPFSLIGYVYFHRAGEYRDLRQSGNAFIGLGAAWTPIDDEHHGKLFSLQLGLSDEHTFAVERAGVPVSESGSSGVFVHPGIVAMVVPRVQFFVLTSLPITQRWKAVEDHQRFRVGAGAIWIFDH